MRKIVTLRRIVINNFRGIQHLDLTFDDFQNDIRGANETGKSTIANSHLWAWSGYDADRQSNYEIKPKDADGKTFDRCLSSVEEFLIVGEYELRIKRELSEVWGPKSEEDLTPEFKENVNKYYIDGQKTKTKAEYDKKLAEIIDPDSFSFMSNPDYFLMLEQAPQRKAILDLVGGDISNEELIKLKPEYEKLVGILKTKTIEFYQKEIKGNIAEGEKQKKNIPILIEEKENEIAKLPTEKEFEEISAKITVKKKELSVLDEAIAKSSDGPEFTAYTKKENELKDLEASLENIKSAFDTAKRKKNEIIENQKIPLSGTLTRNKLKIADFVKSNTEHQSEINILTQDKTILKEQWFSENAKVYKKPEIDGEFLPKCSECGKPYTQTDLDKMDASEVVRFNESKIKKLNEINEYGKKKSARIKELEVSISNNTSEILKLEEISTETQEKLNLLKLDETKVEDSDEFQAISSQIFAKKTELETKPEKDDNKLVSDKASIQSQIDELNKKLGEKTTLEKNIARIDELKQQEKDVNKSLVSWLKAAAITSAYQRDRSGILEEKVNAKFSMIKFQLFDYTNEGKEILVCIPTVPSKRARVPYKVANTALKMAAQIDVANTFSAKTNVVLPLFLDARESVTAIPKTDSQVINLTVDERILSVCLKGSEQYMKYVENWSAKDLVNS